MIGPPWLVGLVSGHVVHEALRMQYHVLSAGADMGM